MSNIRSLIQSLLVVVLFSEVVACQTTVVTRKGSCVYLRCLSDIPKGVYALIWEKEGLSHPVFMKIANYPEKGASGALKGRVDYFMRNATLKIVDVRLEDEGKYGCVVLPINEDSTMLDEDMKNPPTTWTKLVVNEPPMFQRTPPATIERQLGDPLNLNCLVKGRPKPSVTWQKDGLPIRTDNFNNKWEINGGSLVIYKVARQHQGQYVCQGSNIEGDVIHKTTVLVNAPPIIHTKPKSITVKEGGKALFRCKAEGYPSNITYQWQYNGMNRSALPLKIKKRMKTLMKTGTLELSKVRKEDMNATITCIAMNGYKPNPNASASLNVEYAARVINFKPFVYGGLNMPLVVKCTTDANPPTDHVTWYKGDREITNFDVKSNMYVDHLASNHLIFRRLSHRDQDNYKCRPYNIVGSKGISPITQLRVRRPPSIVAEPPENVRVRVGSKFNVSCRGDGDPKPAVYWEQFKYNKDASNHSWVKRKEGITLEIRRVTKGDNGLWRCVVANEIMTLKKSTMVVVLGTSPHQSTNLTVTTTTTTAHLRWVPGFDGGFQQHFIIWYKRFGEESYKWVSKYCSCPDNQYTIEDLKPDTHYEFQLLAENQQGAGNFTKTVYMVTKPVVVSKRKPTNAVYIPPPSGFKFTITGEKLILLQWNPPYKTEGLFGYHIEYRVVENPVRKSNRSKRSPDVAVDTRMTSQWLLFAVVRANMTSHLVQKSCGLVHRDRVYGFRINSVVGGADNYSPSSDPITVNTTGLDYDVYDEPDNYVTMAVVGGSVFMLVFIILVVMIYCYYSKNMCSEKIRREKELNIEKGKYSNLVALKKRSSKASADSIDDFDSHEIAGVEGCSSEEVVVRKKKGGLTRLKRKFSWRGGGNKEGKSQNRIRKEGRTPAAGSPSDSSQIIRRHSTVVHNIQPQDGAINTTAPASQVRRPLSECYLGNRAADVTTQLYHHRDEGIPEEVGEIPEEEDEVYEIDCGRSNVEVRCIRERAPSRALTTRSCLPSNQQQGYMATWRERQQAVDPFMMRYVSLKDIEPQNYHQRDLQTPQPHHYNYHGNQLLGNQGYNAHVYGTWSRQPSFRNFSHTLAQDHRRNRAVSQLAPQTAYQPLGYRNNQHLRPVSPQQDASSRDHQSVKPSGMTSSLSLQFRSNPQLSPSKQPVTSLNKSKSGDDLLSADHQEVERSESSESRKNFSKSNGDALRLESSLPSSGYESRNSSNTSAQLRQLAASTTVRYHDNGGYQTTVRTQRSNVQPHQYYTYDRKSMETRNLGGNHGDKWRQTDLDPKIPLLSAASSGGNPESSKKDTNSSVDDKYEWDAQDPTIKFDPMATDPTIKYELPTDPSLKYDVLSSYQNSDVMNPNNNSRFISENLLEDCSYSKSDMESRCANLKQKYRQLIYTPNVQS